MNHNEAHDSTSRKISLPVGRLTASSLALAKKCPGSFAIGHAETDSPRSLRGTAIHAYLEKLLSEGELDPESVADPEARAVCEKLDPTEIMHVVRGHGLVEEIEDALSGPAKILAEAPLALSPDAKQALLLAETGPEGREARDYSAAPEGYVCGTADALAVTNEAVVITDWKTGRSVGPPERNPQLRFLALAATLAYDVEVALVQICYINPDGSIHPSSAVFEKAELATIADEIKDLIGAVQKGRDGSRGEPVFRLGDHCRNCPAFASCPAIGGAAHALLDLADAREDPEEFSPAKAAEVWKRLVAVEATTKKVRKILQDYLAGHGPAEGIDLTDPEDPESTRRLRLRLIDTRRETIVPEVAMPMLRSIYGDEADKAVSVTKKGLQALAGRKAEEILADLQDTDGTRYTYSESLKEYGG